MIRVDITTSGECGEQVYSLQVEELPDWAGTPQEWAIGQLFEGAEQLARVLGVPRPEPQAPASESEEVEIIGRRTLADRASIGRNDMDRVRAWSERGV